MTLIELVLILLLAAVVGGLVGIPIALWTGHTAWGGVRVGAVLGDLAFFVYLLIAVLFVTKPPPTEM